MTIEFRPICNILKTVPVNEETLCWMGSGYVVLTLYLKACNDTHKLL